MTQVMNQCFLSLSKDAEASGGFIKRVDGVRTYTGTHIDGVLDGTGEIAYGPGCKYQGGLKEGKNEGFGVYTWPNGKTVLSYWRAGVMHGPGLILETNGKTTPGLWEEGKLKHVSSL